MKIDLNTDLKRVILMISEKGGVGKTHTACALVDYARSTNQRIAAYDGDMQGDWKLSKMFAQCDEDGDLPDEQNPTAEVVSYDCSNEEDRAIIVNACSTADPVILHDISAGGLGHLMKVQDGGGGLKRLLRAFASVGYRVTIIHVVTVEDGTTRSVADVLDELELAGAAAEIVDHIVVLNRRDGKKNSAFKTWFEGSRDATTKDRVSGPVTRNRFLAAGGKEIELPMLDPTTCNEIAGLRISFSEAERSRYLTLNEQQYAKNFRMDFAEAIEPVKNLLGLA
ncbi:AAA family ATPase [Bosea beijingensis]|uniref:nucleotide-binding protein n=1 Tax=Bosea beijingensis TaxID=3068632 RepID=UPI0027421919|nr:AAA family ATPase [Bosea sp. REN20]